MDGKGKFLSTVLTKEGIAKTMGNKVKVWFFFPIKAAVQTFVARAAELNPKMVPSCNAMQCFP